MTKPIPDGRRDRLRALLPVTRPPDMTETYWSRTRRFVDGMTPSQIARQDGVSFTAVARGLDTVERQLTGEVGTAARPRARVRTLLDRGGPYTVHDAGRILAITPVAVERLAAQLVLGQRDGPRLLLSHADLERLSRILRASHAE